MVQLHLIFSIRWLLFITCYLWLAIWIFLSTTRYYLQKLVPFARCCTSRNFFFNCAQLYCTMIIVIPIINTCVTALLESMAALCSVGENNQWASTYLGLVHHSVTLNLSCVQLYSQNSCTVITAVQFTVKITLRYFAHAHAHGYFKVFLCIWYWHKHAAFQRSAFGRSTAGNDVVATIFIRLFFFSPRFSLSRPFLIEGVLGSKNLFSESCLERPKT